MCEDHLSGGGGRREVLGRRAMSERSGRRSWVLGVSQVSYWAQLHEEQKVLSFGGEETERVKGDREKNGAGLGD